MSQPTELELKFDVPANGAARLRRLALLKGTAPEKTATLRSTYFDTDKQKLRKSGVSLRVRQVDGRQVQTIKQQGNRGVGLFKRSEWERPIDGPQPDLEAARGTALEPLLSKRLRHRLKPVFETRVRRTIYPIRSNGSEIELTVDRGKVEAAGLSSPLCEIELELKVGEAGELFALARKLAEALPIRPMSKSKAERGYELVGKEAPCAVKAEPIAVAPDTDSVAAFRTIARSCLYQLVANEPALRRNDPEAVHQMRIGVRRLRAAISLFADMLAGPQTEALKSELKWITEQLGPARELDVFLQGVVKQAAGQSQSGSAMGSLAREFRKNRADALAKAEQAVASARFRRLVLDAAAWIEIGDWTHNEDEFARALRDRSVTDAAADELRRRRNKIRKQGGRLAELDPRRRHKLRINAKKLRYATEFFAGAFPGKKSARRRQKFVAKLKKLQDALGDLNDIVVHEGLAKRALAASERGAKRRERHAAKEHAGKEFAAGRLSGREEARFAEVMKIAQQAYRAFTEAEPFWH